MPLTCLLSNARWGHYFEASRPAARRPGKSLIRKTESVKLPEIASLRARQKLHGGEQALFENCEFKDEWPIFGVNPAG